jgi:hypothetical protein
VRAKAIKDLKNTNYGIGTFERDSKFANSPTNEKQIAAPIT